MERINRLHPHFPQLVKHVKHLTPLGSTETDTMTQSGPIETSREGNVAVVELNKPKKRNALSQDLMNELIEMLPTRR